ncbi:MAG: rRNA pseudouridine synthase, partial [Defluviitaleaceae bacterium]|nr:rRNA pseudouridine synthase [Defluviitaleaceae bacterium]
MEMRLQKYMAEAGICSRRRAESMIAAGRVSINGAAAGLGAKISGGEDIRIDGKPIGTREKNVYFMLNKPEGYITTARDQFGRPTVLSLIETDTRIYPIGRLDYDTSGLLLLTNDGDLTYRLTHPKHQIEKIYEARILGGCTSKEIEIFRRGILIDGYKTRPARLSLIREQGKYSIVQIAITEGRNRQVR